MPRFVELSHPIVFGMVTVPGRLAPSTLLAAGIPIVEHLTGLEQLPADGFRFTAAPPRVVGMGTWPVRAYAVIE